MSLAMGGFGVVHGNGWRTPKSAFPPPPPLYSLSQLNVFPPEKGSFCLCKMGQLIVPNEILSNGSITARGIPLFVSINPKMCLPAPCWRDELETQLETSSGALPLVEIKTLVLNGEIKCALNPALNPFSSP